MRVAVCDDSPGFPMLVSAWLETDARFASVGVAHAGERLRALVAAEAPDVVVLDLLIPDVPDPPALVRELRQLCDGIRVVMVSSLPEDSLAGAAASAGADAFLNKSASPDTLLELLHRVTRGR